MKHQLQVKPYFRWKMGDGVHTDLLKVHLCVCKSVTHQHVAPLLSSPSLINWLLYFLCMFVTCWHSFQSFCFFLHFSFSPPSCLVFLPLVPVLPLTWEACCSVIMAMGEPEAAIRLRWCWNGIWAVLGRRRLLRIRGAWFWSGAKLGRGTTTTAGMSVSFPR